MEFTTDDQTIKDLNIFPKQKEESSLFDYFNECSTWGGKEELRLMFCHPSNDLKLIYARIKSL